MKRLIVYLNCFLLLPIGVVLGQQRVAVQVETGTIADVQDVVFFDLPELRRGDVLYVVVEATSGDLDTFIVLGSEAFDEFYAQDDDSAAGTNSQITFKVSLDGHYTLAVANCCHQSTGDFRVTFGLNAPDVLNGDVTPSGETFVLPYEPSLTAANCNNLRPRPTLSGVEQRRETDRFVIHFTTQGRDGATPNFVDDVQSIIEGIWDELIVWEGWYVPPLDCGEGGDKRFDIYLMEIISTEEAVGYAVPEAIVGDNENSPKVEQYSAYGYLVLDNDFAGVARDREVMRATTAHEFHHIIQFGYDLNEPLRMLPEATATWIETRLFPETDSASVYIRDLLSYPDLCIGATPDDPLFAGRIYGEWLLIDSIAQDYGADAIRRLWEHIAGVEGLNALYDTLYELGTTPQSMIERYAVRNLLFDYGIENYFTDRVRVESNINGVGEVVPRRDGVQQMSADYLLVTNKQVYTFSIAQPELAMLLVGIHQREHTAQVFQLGQQGTVDTRPFDYAYLIIANTRTHDNPRRCTTLDWLLTVSNGNTDALTPPDDEVWDATNFIPAG